MSDDSSVYAEEREGTRRPREGEGHVHQRVGADQKMKQLSVYFLCSFVFSVRLEIRVTNIAKESEFASKAEATHIRIFLPLSPSGQSTRSPAHLTSDRVASATPQPPDRFERARIRRARP